MKRGTESALLPILCKGAIYLITVKGADPLPQYRITGLELTIERFYQTHSHNLVRSFLRRRNMSLSRIHCCYIIIGTEFKMSYFVITINSGFED